MPKLITGHTQNNEPLGGVTIVKLVHLSVVPGCCSSKRRHIFNEHNFPLQCGETERLSGQQLSCQVVKPSDIPGHCELQMNVVVRNVLFISIWTVQCQQGQPSLIYGAGHKRNSQS